MHTVIFVTDMGSDFCPNVPSPPPQRWCRENFVHQRNMRTALDVRSQLEDLCGRQGVGLVSSQDSRAIRQALLAGLFTQTAEHRGEGKYQTVGQRVWAGKSLN